MKKIFFLSLMLLSFAGFTQTKQVDRINIKMDTLSKAVRVADIIDVDIRSCRILSYHFTAKPGKNAKSIDVTGEELTQEVKENIKMLTVGEHFVIDNIKYECTPEFKRNFNFVIVK